MGRKPRIHVAGAFHHVVHRGNNHNEIFFAAADRTRYCTLLEEGVARYGHRIHAFCLMTNHTHLLIEVGTVSLSRIMHNLSFRYSRWINNRLGRVGHLFERRFRDKAVIDDSHLLYVVRYIHANPVRAGLVRDPSDFPWSTHRAYMALECLDWTTTNRILGIFDADPSVARQAYLDWMNVEPAGELPDAEPARERTDNSDTSSLQVDGCSHDEPRGSGVVGIAVGDLLSAVAEEYGLTAEQLAMQGNHRIAAEARTVAAFIYREKRMGSLRRLGEMFRRDPSALSHGLSRLDRRSTHDAMIKTRVRRILGRLTVSKDSTVDR